MHNGIIENHDELRAELKAKGYAFETQTDTEVIAHLVHSLYKGSLLDAVRRAVKRLDGRLRDRRGVAAASRTQSSARARAARW